MLQAPLNVTEGLVAFSARSEFNTESGAINGDSLAVGGTWATSGATTDFSASGGVATRATTSDASTRFALVDTNMTNTVVRVDVKWSATTAAVESTLAARYASGDYLYAVLVGGSSPTVTVTKAIGGLGTNLLASVPVQVSANQFHTLQLVATSSGQWQVYFGPQGSPALLGQGHDSALATGGALATGDVGIFDENSTATACTRTYDNFAAWAPDADAVVYASRSLELNTLGITRQDSGGTAYGPVSVVGGDLPRIPNRASGGTAEFIVKASRGDLESINDPAIDDLSVRVYRRPSYLFVN